jgi:hypothetical protein
MSMRDTTKQRLVDSGLFDESAGSLVAEDQTLLMGEILAAVKTRLRFNSAGDLIGVDVWAESIAHAPALDEAV